ncbi:MAG: hypothetical protein ACRBK7_26340 [Acidimicrobiales bacterium]
MGLEIADGEVQKLLCGLLGREVAVSPVDTVEPHSATARGLVTEEDELVAVIASDLFFAHSSGAALAMIPAHTLDGKENDPDEELMEVYQEVANVVSRVVNEASPKRLRLDPNMDHPVDTLEAIVVEGNVLSSVSTDIEGYGIGKLGVWYLD